MSLACNERLALSHKDGEGHLGDRASILAPYYNHLQALLITNDTHGTYSRATMGLQSF